MTAARKTGSARTTDLRLAVARIVKGRSKFGEIKLSIAGVAREAGISAALIHNCYPEIAELVRTKQGKSSREQRDAKQLKLLEQRHRSKELREEMSHLRKQVASLASINEVLLEENRALKAQLSDSKIHVLRLGK
jgi:DNA-binding transcriptional regulator YhcF (GntR family)